MNTIIMACEHWKESMYERCYYFEPDSDLCANGDCPAAYDFCPTGGRQNRRRVQLKNGAIVIETPYHIRRALSDNSLWPMGHQIFTNPETFGAKLINGTYNFADSHQHDIDFGPNGDATTPGFFKND